VAGPGHAQTCPMVDRLKATQEGQHQHGADAYWGVLDGGAHWRNLANTIEPSMCGGNATLSNYFDHLFYKCFDGRIMWTHCSTALPPGT